MRDFGRHALAAPACKFGSMGMKRPVLLVLLIILTAFVLHSAARIEILNVRAGNYLPRRDHNPEGGLIDGKWRISLENNARDQLRAAVGTFGLMQYILTPLLLIFSLAVFFKTSRSWTHAVAAFSVFASVIAISVMLYRSYWESLGW